MVNETCRRRRRLDINNNNWCFIWQRVAVGKLISVLGINKNKGGFVSC